MDLTKQSAVFRNEILTPSGGWLADVLIVLSRRLRVWEPFLAAVVFMASWVTLRLSSRRTAFVLALVYDWTIPIQCGRNSRLRSDVAQHLRIYWRVWASVTLIELLALAVLSEGPALRLICAKTTLMVVLWLARLDDRFVLDAIFKRRVSSVKQKEPKRRAHTGSEPTVKSQTTRRMSFSRASEGDDAARPKHLASKNAGGTRRGSQRPEKKTQMSDERNDRLLHAHASRLRPSEGRREGEFATRRCVANYRWYIAIKASMTGDTNCRILSAWAPRPLIGSSKDATAYEDIVESDMKYTQPLDTLRQLRWGTASAMADKSMYTTVRATLTEVSQYVVNEWLQNTGWLLQSVLWLEEKGIWAPLGLSLTFISSWVGIRIAPKEWAMASGASFDLLIPIQNTGADGAQAGKSFPAYWSRWSALTVVELVLYFILDQSSFTLLVASKTFLMMIYWIYVSSPRGPASGGKRGHRRRAGGLGESSGSEGEYASDAPESPELDMGSMSREEKIERIHRYEEESLGPKFVPVGLSDLTDEDDESIDEYLRELEAASRKERQEQKDYLRKELRRGRKRPEGDAKDPAKRKARDTTESKIPADRKARVAALRQQGHPNPVDLEDQIAHLQSVGQHDEAEREWARLVPPQSPEAGSDSSYSGSEDGPPPQRQTRERVVRRSAASSESDSGSEVEDHQTHRRPSRRDAKEGRTSRKTKRTSSAQSSQHASSDEGEAGDSEGNSETSERVTRRQKQRKRLTMPTLEGDPDADQRLFDLGYEDPRARYMMLRRQARSKPDLVQWNWDAWGESSAKVIKQRERKYIDEYKKLKRGGRSSNSSAPASATSDTSQASRVSHASGSSRVSLASVASVPDPPQDPRYPQLDDDLVAAGYSDPFARAAMREMIDDDDVDEAEAEEMRTKLLNAEPEERQYYEIQYGKRGREIDRRMQPPKNPGGLRDDEIAVLAEQYEMALDEPFNNDEDKYIADQYLWSRIGEDLPQEIRDSRFKDMSKGRRELMMQKYRRELKSGDKWKARLRDLKTTGHDLRRIYDPTLRRLRIKYGWSSSLTNAAQRLFEDAKEGEALRRDVRAALAKAEDHDDWKDLNTVARQIGDRVKDEDVEEWTSMK